MGGSESSPYENHGYRILEITEGSPLSKTDIKEMVDFICYEPNSISGIILKHIM